MPQKDHIHDVVKRALVADGWDVTDDPYVISYGERFLFVDLGAVEASMRGPVGGQFIGAQRGGSRIAVEIKDFRGKSMIASLEQAIGQYVLYRLLLNKVDPERELTWPSPTSLMTKSSASRSASSSSATYLFACS